MNFQKIAVLTSKKSWHIPYSQKLIAKLNKRGYETTLFSDHGEIGHEFEIVFILSYFKILNTQFLKMHKHNIVVHESDLPKGRGWAPLFWQVLENKNEIPIVLFEASENTDEGDIYLKDTIVYEGHELNSEIRQKQALKTIELCLRFLDTYMYLKPTKQIEAPTYYAKRTQKDSELDIDKSINEQFNLLRIVNNEDFPAFFNHNGYKYTIKIFKNEEDTIK